MTPAGHAYSKGTGAAAPYRLAGDDGADSGAPGLRHALLRSLSWVSVARAVSGFGAVGRYVGFSRVLTPFDLGVVGAAFFFEVLFATTANPNFERALVAEPAAVEPYLDTV